jgi:hypothetical protein
MNGSATLLHVFVSLILGILAYAAMGAVNTWWRRNRNDLREREALPLLQVILKFFALSACIVAVILTVRELLPYEMASVQGMLKGERLFPVRAIERYEAVLDVDGDRVEAEGPLVTYYRKLGPAELAEARLERQLLLEQLDELESRLAAGNPIGDLQRLSQVESLRAQRSQQQQERSRAMWELESLNFKLEEQEARVSLARKEVDFAREAVKNGLVSKIEYDRRTETLRMEEARLEELASRRDFAVESLIDFAPPAGEEMLTDLDEVLEQGGVDSFLGSSRAGLERRLRQLERLLAGEAQEPLAITAPWSGLLGYRNPSSVLEAGELVAVVVQPDSLFLEVLVPTMLAEDLRRDADIVVSNEELEQLGVELRGQVTRAEPENPDQTMLELRIEPRADLVKDLAMNREVKLTASFINRPPAIMTELGYFLRDLSSRDVALFLTAVLLGLIAIYRRQEGQGGGAAAGAA